MADLNAFIRHYLYSKETKIIYVDMIHFYITLECNSSKLCMLEVSPRVLWTGVFSVGQTGLNYL